MTSRRAGLAAAVLAWLVLSPGTESWAQGTQPASPRAPAAAATAAPANALTEAARRLGVARCLPALQRLSHASLTGATAHDIVVDWDRAAPDAAPFSGLMGVVVPGSGVHATSLMAAPDPTGGCSVMAERIAWAPKACASVRSEELPSHQAAPLLPGMQVLVHPSDVGSTVSLLDAGPGCLVIRRYVAYRWKNPTTP